MVLSIHNWIFREICTKINIIWIYNWNIIIDIVKGSVRDKTFMKFPDIKNLLRTYDSNLSRG